MTPTDAQRILDSMSTKQRAALADYAARKREGRAVPVDVVKRAADALKFTARALGIQIRGGQETQDALAAVAGVIGREAGR